MRLTLSMIIVISIIILYLLQLSTKQSSANGNWQQLRQTIILKGKHLNEFYIENSTVLNVILASLPVILGFVGVCYSLIKGGCLSKLHKYSMRNRSDNANLQCRRQSFESQQHSVQSQSQSVINSLECDESSSNIRARVEESLNKQSFPH